MGFTPYWCGQCWKYRLLSRAGESCPYLQPRVQVRGSPTALQGMNQNAGGQSLYIPLLPENNNIGTSKPPLPGVEHPPRGNISHRMGLSAGLAATWLGGPAPVTRQWNLGWRGGWVWAAMKKNIAQDLQSSAVEGNSPCIPSLCQGFVAEPTKLRTLNSKWEEFGTVQGSPSNFASIPQQCLCLLNIFWV